MSFKCDYSASPYFQYIDRVIFASCSAQVLWNVVMTLVFVNCMKQKLHYAVNSEILLTSITETFLYYLKNERVKM